MDSFEQISHNLLCQYGGLQLTSTSLQCEMIYMNLWPISSKPTSCLKYW